MQMITMDTTNSTHESIEEEMLVAVLCAIKSENDVIRVYNANRKETVCISYTVDNLKVSIASYKKVKSGITNIFSDFFKEPQNDFWKQSSLNDGLWIYYMIWDPSVCDTMRTSMMPSEQYH